MIDAAAGLIDPFDLVRWVEQWHAAVTAIRNTGGLKNTEGDE